MNAYKRWLIIGFSLSLVILTVSCSMTRIGLKYYDWLLVRELTKTFDLSSEQKKQAYVIVEKNDAWVRTKWLPELLKAVQANLDVTAVTPLSLQSILDLFAEFKMFRTKILSHLSSDLYTLTRTLSQDQITHAQEALKRRDEKLLNLIPLDDESLVKKRQAMLRANVERWYGAISDEQADEICRIFGCGRSDVLKSLSMRELSKDVFLKGIALSQTEDEFKAMLEAWSNQGTLPDRSDRTYRQNVQIMAEKLHGLEMLMSDLQRQKMRAKVKELMSDFEWFSTNNP